MISFTIGMRTSYASIDDGQTEDDESTVMQPSRVETVKKLLAVVILIVLALSLGYVFNSPIDDGFSLPVRGIRSIDNAFLCSLSSNKYARIEGDALLFTESIPWHHGSSLTLVSIGECLNVKAIDGRWIINMGTP